MTQDGSGRNAFQRESGRPDLLTALASFQLPVCFGSSPLLKLCRLEAVKVKLGEKASQPASQGRSLPLWTALKPHWTNASPRVSTLVWSMPRRIRYPPACLSARYDSPLFTSMENVRGTVAAQTAPHRLLPVGSLA